MNIVVEEMFENAINCIDIENIADDKKQINLFSDEFLEELDTIKFPITKFNALLKLLKIAISTYSKTNKVKALEFDKRLITVVEKFNNRDKLVFTSEVVSVFINGLSVEIMRILNDLKDDKTSFEKLRITYEEKSFYDILIKIRDDYGFVYFDDKYLVLAKKIKEFVDDKAKYAGWSSKNDLKSELNMDLAVLL